MLSFSTLSGAFSLLMRRVGRIMSDMKRFASRGYSILAALVFVAVLSSIAAAVNILGSSGDPIAMISAAGSIAKVDPGVKPTQIQAPQLGTGQEAGSERQCTPGFDYKVSRSVTGNPTITPVLVCPKPGQGPGQQQNIEPNAQPANGGFQSASAVLAAGGSDTAGEGTFGLRNDPQRCRIAPNMKPPQYEPKPGFKCKIRYCIPIGGSAGDGACIDTQGGVDEKQKLDPATIQNSLRGDLIASVMQDTPPSEQSKILRELGVTQSEQAGLNSVYSEYKTIAQAEIQKNQNELDRLRQYIDSCSDCSTSDLKPHQDRVAALEQKNAELAKRMEALKSAETSTVTPPSRPPGAPGGPPLPPPDPRKQQTFPDPGPDDSRSGGGGNPLGALGSLLSNFAKGFARSGAGQGAPCPADPNAYQQQQQQYQMELQQYNLALQQYNYQQERAYYFGGTPPEPPMAPVPCSPNPNANSCPAAPPQPSTACSGSWRPVMTQQSNGRQCPSSWQCVPSNATPPTAELSCQPKVVDVGMTVALTFACANATGSTGGGAGFDTNNETSGSRNVKIENPPSSASGINFGITCRNQNLTAKAECAVQIARPAIVLLANPRIVPSGELSRIGWVTSGMSSCIVSSPQMPGFTQQNANNTSVNGVATTSPITRDTTVVLTCQTLGGGTKAASTTITVGSATSSAPLSVASSIDGDTDVRHGDTASITWDTSSAPANSAVALWLVDMASGHSTGLIARNLATSGTYAWTIPATSTACAVDLIAVCGADLIAGRSYAIQASLYSPPNAHLGGYPPADPVTPVIHDEDVAPAFRIVN